MTYLIFAVLVVVLTAAATLPTLRRLAWRPIVWTGVALIALTAVFDNVLVGVGIVDYDEDLIVGLRVPIAPIEDFSYTLAVVLLVPALWTWLGRGRAGEVKADEAAHVGDEASAEGRGK